MKRFSFSLLLLALLITLPACGASLSPLSSAGVGVGNGFSVYWQARMNDTLTVSVRMNYDAQLKTGERARLADATVMRRGQMKRERVVLRNVECREEGGAVLELSFTCDFEYRGVRYRLRGRYTDDPENTGSGRQSIQCVPLVLGRDIIEQGGYQPTRH